MFRVCLVSCLVCAWCACRAFRLCVVVGCCSCVALCYVIVRFHSNHDPSHNGYDTEKLEKGNITSTWSNMRQHKTTTTTNSSTNRSIGATTRTRQRDKHHQQPTAESQTHKAQHANMHIHTRTYMKIIHM